MQDLGEKINFETICRLCLSSDKDLSSIFSPVPLPNILQLTLAEKILDSTSLQVCEQDGLPSQICSACLDLVDAFHNFKRRCITSDETLRAYLHLKDPSNEVKSELDEDEDIALETEKLNNDPQIVASSNGSNNSSPPNPKWDCEALDVEVKVEITENPDNETSMSIPGPRRRRNLTKHDKMTIFKDVFPCSKCDKVFAHKNSLTRHEISHSDERFVCFYCGKRLTTRDTLLRHVKAHTGEKRYRCEHCGKSYTSSTSYSSHIRKHTGERPYKCSQCKESFSLSSSLDRHIAKHRGTKSFVCEVCDASFWVADDLRSHVNRVH